MISKKIKKYISVTVFSITILSLLAGCSNKKTDGSDTTDVSTPTKISAMSILMSAQPPRIEGNTILDKIKETTNVELDVSFVPSGSYKEKFNVTLASNSLPMATVVDGGMLRTTSVLSAISNGVFWEVGPLLDSYPNLKKFYSDQIVLDNCKIDGKLYGLPRPRVLGRVGLIIRQDWLDNLGLEVPTTVEEVYDVAKAFTLNDPDKDGKANTVGIEYADISVGSVGWNGIDTLTVAAGGTNQWGLEDGKMVPSFATKEYISTLGWLKKMYKEKIMNQDFALVTGTKRADAFDQGKVGMAFATLDDAGSNTNETKSGARPNLMSTVPTAKITIVPALSGPSGPKVPATGGHNGMVMFSKNAVKTEADLKKILSFYDKMATTEMIDLFTYGVEGVNYNVENGVRKSITDSKFADDSYALTMLILRPAQVETPEDKAITKQINAAFTTNKEFLVVNPIEALNSETKNQVGGQLDKLVMDARIKYVMGQIDDAEYNKFIENWRAQGGDKVIDELTASYNESIK